MTDSHSSFARVLIAIAVLATMVASAVAVGVAGATGPATLNLNVLLIGTGSSDPTTAAWQATLTSEGVPSRW